MVEFVALVDFRVQANTRTEAGGRLRLPAPGVSYQATRSAIRGIRAGRTAEGTS
jgi:hypothetical protein